MSVTLSVPIIPAHNGGDFNRNAVKDLQFNVFKITRTTHEVECTIDYEYNPNYVFQIR